MSSETDNDKREVLSHLLGSGEVFVEVDGRQPGVRVPEGLDIDNLMLKLSWAYGYRLELTDAGIDAVLTFGGAGQAVFVPWAAVKGASSPTMRTGYRFAPPPPPAPKHPRLRLVN